ncbi:MAG: hypothetical protein K0Q79_1503 [Flavipsychrobacter sp.]|jgi:hypothetical protein|nr:hypothetical protein [Flavipsychrobacter sp.]
MPSVPITFFDSKDVEWSDLSIFVGGSQLTKIRSVKYGVKTTKTHLYAEGDSPISIQSGNRQPQGSIKVLKTAIDALNAAALSAGGRDITGLVFDIVIVWKAQGTRPLQTDTLVGCQVSDFQKSIDQGSDKMEVELPFLFLQLLSD